MGHKYNIQKILNRISCFNAEYVLGENGKRKAAVAMLLRESSGKLDMLFIERSTDERDPWSGHLAFPGGKIEHGETSQQAAERETMEEIGILLNNAYRIGQLSDIVGSNLPVQVSCHIYLLRFQITPVLNNEVKDLFWVPLSELYDQKRQCNRLVRFGDNLLEVPAIQLPVTEKPVLWGITYRLVMQLYEIINSK